MGRGWGWVGWKKQDIMQNSVQLNLPTGTGTELGNIKKNVTQYKQILFEWGQCEKIHFAWIPK